MKALKDIFLDSQEWLFHGSCREIKGGFLVPQADLTGTEGHHKRLCATHNRLNAILYATRTDDTVCILSLYDRAASGKITEYPFTVIENRTNFLESYKGGRVYRLPKDGFVRCGGVDIEGIDTKTQWNSEQSYPVDDSNTYEVPDLQTVMRMGGQVFFLQDGLTGSDFWKLDNLRCLKDFLEHPALIWENAAHGIPLQPTPTFTHVRPRPPVISPSP